MVLIKFYWIDEREKEKGCMFIIENFFTFITFSNILYNGYKKM